jgi:hypothetical protein
MRNPHPKGTPQLNRMARSISSASWQLDSLRRDAYTLRHAGGRTISGECTAAKSGSGDSRWGRCVGDQSSGSSTDRFVVPPQVVPDSLERAPGLPVRQQQILNAIARVTLGLWATVGACTTTPSLDSKAVHCEAGRRIAAAQDRCSTLSAAMLPGLANGTSNRRRRPRFDPVLQASRNTRDPPSCPGPLNGAGHSPRLRPRG